MKKILLTIVFAVLTMNTVIFAQESKTYKVGDTGPAGGIIFFDRGFTDDGWQYLEAAPAETEWSGIQWGAFQQDVVGTSTAVGNGKRNTQVIVEHLNRKNETNRAAQLCVDLNFCGFTDWFLPSKDELALMFQNLKMKGLGGFADAWYWSSSQYFYNRAAWVHGFQNGPQLSGNKNSTVRVRAVRAF